MLPRSIAVIFEAYIRIVAESVAEVRSLNAEPKGAADRIVAFPPFGAPVRQRAFAGSGRPLDDRRAGTVGDPQDSRDLLETEGFGSREDLNSVMKAAVRIAFHDPSRTAGSC